MSAGYSGTPLAKKLGIKAGSRVLVYGEPRDYRELLEPLPAGVTFARTASERIDVAHVFVVERAVLDARLKMLRKSLRADAALWVSWPKKSAKLATDVTEDTVREIALPLGLVDIKVCAVSAVWSALKLVVRRELR